MGLIFERTLAEIDRRTAELEKQLRRHQKDRARLDEQIAETLEKLELLRERYAIMTEDRHAGEVPDWPPEVDE